MMLASFVIFPVMLGFVSIAPEMFAILLGDKWMPTVPFFEILALSGLFYPLAIIAYNILKVRSDGRIIFRLEILKRIIMTLMLVLCIPQGIEAVAWGMSTMALVEFIINFTAARRYVRDTHEGVMRAILPQLLLAAVMFGGIELLDTYFAELTLGLRLISKVAVGAAIYLCGAWLCRLQALGEGIILIRGFFKK